MLILLSILEQNQKVRLPEIILLQEPLKDPVLNSVPLFSYSASDSKYIENIESQNIKKRKEMGKKRKRNLRKKKRLSGKRVC